VADGRVLVAIHLTQKLAPSSLDVVGLVAIIWT
jgi:hypothetical protein